MASTPKNAFHTAQIIPFPHRRGHMNDRLWKQLTSRGNQAFAEQRWSEAEDCYRRALVEAKRLFDDAHDQHGMEDDNAAPRMVVSAANIAESWLHSGEDQQACEEMLALSHRFCLTIEDEGAPLAFRRQCLDHLGPTCVELIGILPRAGLSEEATGQAVSHAKAVALRFIDTLSTKH